MKKLFYALIALSFAMGSCKDSIKEKESKDLETINNNITKKLNALAANDPDGITIDSVLLIKVDTLTEKKDSMHTVFAYYDKIDEILRQMKLHNELAKNRFETAKLYREIDVDHFSTQEEGEIALEKAKLMSDLSKNVLEHVQSVNKLIESGKLDSVKTTGYIGIVKVYAHDKSMTSKNLDSLRFLLDTNFLINNKLAEIREFDPKKLK